MRFARSLYRIVLGGSIITTIVACGDRDHSHLKQSDALNASIVVPRQIGSALVFGDTDLTGNRNIAGGFPMVSSKKIASPGDVVVSRQQFVVSYDSKAKVPAWTSWQIVGEDLGRADRSNDFHSDTILNNYLELKIKELGITPDDYIGSCFDKGHQSPSADRTNSGADNSATFYMSNMAPQTAFLNRRIWKSLESRSRDLVIKEGRKLQIYAGSILRDGRETIGRDKNIQVPESFYKVIAIYESNSASNPTTYIAVIMPNLTSDGLDPIANIQTTCAEQKRGGSGTLSTNWEDYRVSLKDIEAKAGVKFSQFANLPEYSGTAQNASN